MYICMFVCLFVCLYVCTCANGCTCIQVRVCEYMDVLYICVLVFMYVHTFTHMYVRTYVRTNASDIVFSIIMSTPKLGSGVFIRMEERRSCIRNFKRRNLHTG